MFDTSHDQKRSTDSPMDWEWQTQGPCDPTTPFPQHKPEDGHKGKFQVYLAKTVSGLQSWRYKIVSNSRICSAFKLLHCYIINLNTFHYSTKKLRSRNVSRNVFRNDGHGYFASKLYRFPYTRPTKTVSNKVNSG